MIRFLTSQEEHLRPLFVGHSPFTQQLENREEKRAQVLLPNL